MFKTLLATVRAKRSQGSRKISTRDYTVRVRHSGGAEELIQYSQYGYGDFELRAGDLAAFSYIGPSLIVTQNLTVSRYNVNTTTWREIMYGIVTAIVIGAAIWWFFIRR